MGDSSVLIVSDDPAFVRATRRLLADLGYNLPPPVAWRDACAAIRRRTPALALLDIDERAPETGWSILQVLWLDRATSQLPLIVCAPAVELTPPRRARLRRDHRAHVVKPIEPRNLAAAVQRLLPLPQPRRETGS
jgi:CheY-like chemotaxis protein